MRFKIVFNRTGRHKMLPVDYQYYISAWIYKVIGKADKEFSAFLHTQGYGQGKKRFKHFNYSPLDFGKPKLWKEKSLFEISKEQVSLKVSFLLNEAAEKFIFGLFNNQQVYIGDRFNGIDFSVEIIERLPDIQITETMHYKALSPIVISFLNERTKYAQYLSPETEGYSNLLKQHMLNKYKTLPDATPLPEDFDFCFEQTGKHKSKLVTIKPYTPQQSKIRGFIYEFKLTAPQQIHQLLLNAGMGEKNAMGFGWCDVKYLS